MPEGIQVLEGKYYHSTGMGYVNRGFEKIVLRGRVNYLPIYSKCNQLLPYTQNQINDLPQKSQLQTVHCLGSLSMGAPNSSFNESSNPQFDRSINLVKKSFRNAKLDNEVEEDPMQNYTEKPEDECGLKKLVSFSGEDKGRQEEISLAKELEIERQLRMNLEKQYNNLLTQAMKQKFTGESEEEQLAEKTQRNQMKGSYAKTRRMQTKPISDDEDFESGTLNPDYQKTLKNSPMQVQNQDLLFQELNRINCKLSDLENSMAVREQRLKRQILERQLQNKQKEFEKIRFQKNTQNSSGKEVQGYSFNYFVLFLLGMLLTKVFLC